MFNRLTALPAVPVRPPAGFRSVRSALVAAGLALCLVGADATAQTLTVGGRRCATPDPGVSEVLRSVQTVNARRAAVRSGAGVLAAEETIVVPVAFHVLTAGDGVEEGNVPDERIEAQIDVLNAAFAPVGVRFVLAAVQRVRNPAWYDGLRINSVEETAMKEALALDPSQYLNIYTAALGLDYLGWASLPTDGAEEDLMQGVVVLDQSLPGGSAAPFNLGHTVTHEVGHWAGLLHTFQGGCSSPNDGVGDTPQERSAASGCPPARDSCPLDPGLDPITNYMDYSDDACMTGFTAGQRERARALTAEHRPTIVAAGRVLANIGAGSFEGAFVGVPSVSPLRIVNLTGRPLTVTAAASSNPAFSVAAGGLVVPAGGVATVPVTFLAPTVGAEEGTIRLETLEAGTLEVAVRGTVTLAPTARVASPSVEAELIEDDGAELRLALTNVGGGALTFVVDTERLPRGIAAVEPAAGALSAGGEVALVLTLSSAGVPVGMSDEPLVIQTNDPERPTVEVPVRFSVLARPDALAIAPAFPNPGRGRITIPLQLPADEDDVTVEIFDTSGRLVATVASGVALDAGYPRVTWDASGAAAGLYVVRVRTPQAAAIGRLTIVR